MQLTDYFVAMGRQLTGFVTTAVPRVVAAVAVAITLVVVAKAVERILRGVCERIGLDGVAERLGMTPQLKRFGITQSLSALLPRVVYVLLLLLFAQTGAELFGLAPIVASIGALFGYLPSIASAVAVLIGGSLLSDFGGRAVRAAAANAGIEAAKPLGNIVSALVLFVCGIIALAQLKIDTEIIRIVTFCLLAALSLAFGLSFGLGTRDITRSMIAGFYARRVMAPGDVIRVADREGILRSITPTQTILEHGGELVALSNGVHLDGTVVVRPGDPGDAPPASRS
jgi:small-conductance mechanosensitive channel